MSITTFELVFTKGEKTFEEFKKEWDKSVDNFSGGLYPLDRWYQPIRDMVETAVLTGKGSLKLPHDVYDYNEYVRVYESLCAGVVPELQDWDEECSAKVTVINPIEKDETIYDVFLYEGVNTDSRYIGGYRGISEYTYKPNGLHMLKYRHGSPIEYIVPYHAFGVAEICLHGQLDM